MIDPKIFQARMKAVEVAARNPELSTEEVIRQSRELVEFLLEGHLQRERLALHAISDVLDNHSWFKQPIELLEKVEKIVEDGLGLNDNE